jgi:hypothetical protein
MLSPTKLAQLGDGDFFSETVRVLDVLAERVKELEARVKQLEARETLKYHGVWESGRQYRPGAFVTDKGSVWHANVVTKSRPGEAPTEWTLAVKRGARA